MKRTEERIQADIAEQAAHWFVANDEAPLDAQDAAALAAWLRSSPQNIEKFLGVSVIVGDLRQAVADPSYSLEATLAMARAEDSAPLPGRWSRIADSVKVAAPRRWPVAAAAVAASAILGIALSSLWNGRPAVPPAATGGATAEYYETLHGQRLDRRLADGTVVHLNTDSSVTVRYTGQQRLVVLTSGQAAFEVAHEPGRVFRVTAGSAEVSDVGTKFDVRLDRDRTVITVLEGRVSVRSARAFERPASRDGRKPAPDFVLLTADQQLIVADGRWSAGIVAVNAERTAAWLHRQIVFEGEPLERVAAEFNRYATTPIEIESPALKSLKISGVFATDDTAAFIAFLRSLKGVRVEVTPTRIRVFQEPRAAAKNFT